MHLGFVCLVNVFLIVVSSDIAFVMAMLTVSRTQVLVIGERLEMNCSVIGSGLTTWTYTSWNTSTQREIYSGVDIFDSVKSRYKIDKIISGQHNIIIDSVDLDHAGKYKCTSGIQKRLRADIELIVLGSHPVCASNISQTQHDKNEHRYPHLYVWCSISYTGNGDPVFSWTKSNEQQNIATNTTTSASTNAPLTTTSSIKEQLHSNDSGVVFQSRITIRVPDRNTTNDFEYTWNYTLYGPRNLSIIEHKDRLECSADGNPTPIYRWTDVDTNVSTDGPVYMTNHIKKKEHTLECTAANIFAAENKNYTIKVPLTYAGMTQVALVFPVIAFSIGPSLCLLVMAVIALCVVHRKRQKNASSNRPDVSLDTNLTSNGNSAIKVTSADPGNDPFQNTEASYSALNVQPFTTEDSRLYCEIRLSEQSSADYGNQACEQKRSKGKTSQANKQRGAGSTLLPPIPHQSRGLPSVPSVNLAQKTMSAKRPNAQITDNSASYCALRPRLTAAQQPELYCELRLNDQQSADYIKH